MATADLDALAGFIQSLPDGQPLALGDGPAVTKEQLAEAYNELNEHRQFAIDFEEEMGELADLREMREQLIEYLQDNGDGVLYGIVHGDETEQDPVVAAGLAALEKLGVEPTKENLARIIEMQNAVTTQSPIEAPQALQLAPAVQLPTNPPRRARRVAVAKPAQEGMEDFPEARLSHRNPVPANPPPLVELTAEQVLGLRRGANGRYDSGDLQA